MHKKDVYWLIGLYHCATTVPTTNEQLNTGKIVRSVSDTIILPINWLP